MKNNLNLRKPTPDDAADALGIAICHSNFYSSGLGRKESKMIEFLHGELQFKGDNYLVLQVGGRL